MTGAWEEEARFGNESHVRPPSTSKDGMCLARLSALWEGLWHEQKGAGSFISSCPCSFEGRPGLAELQELGAGLGLHAWSGQPGVYDDRLTQELPKPHARSEPGAEEFFLRNYLAVAALKA